VPALTLQYVSTAANAEPIFVAHYLLPPGVAVPATIQAQLTFNGTAGTQYNVGQNRARQMASVKSAALPRCQTPRIICRNILPPSPILAFALCLSLRVREGVRAVFRHVTGIFSLPVSLHLSLHLSLPGMCEGCNEKPLCHVGGAVARRDGSCNRGAGWPG
jgi:hypothetical protein